MEFSLRPQGFMEFLNNNNHQVVNKMKSFLFHFVNCLMVVAFWKLRETQGLQTKFHCIEYINLIYIIYYYYIIDLS